MDDPNITMIEYIRLEEEKARKCRKVFNWETAKYGKIWYGEDIHDIRFVETEFPAIVFDDNLTSNETISCEPMIWLFHQEIRDTRNLPGTYIIGNSLHYQDYEWYEALEDGELKEEALRNKAIMEGIIDDDDESSYERRK
nr:hypothetical protein [Tanacetum cinerariifolium]